MIAALPISPDWSLGRGEQAAGGRARQVAPDPARNGRWSDAEAESRGPGPSHRGRGRGLRDRLRQRRGQAARAGQVEAGIDPQRLPDAPPFRPQRGLRQPAPARLGIRSRDAGRHVGSSSARGDDAPVSRDERLRHPHAHRRRGQAAPEGPDRDARDRRGGSGDAGRQRQSHGRPGRPSAGEPRSRLPFRLSRSLDRHLGRYPAFEGPRQARGGRRRARARSHAPALGGPARREASRTRRSSASISSPATRRRNRSAASRSKRR